jgi:hypothetical protein
MMGFKKDIPMTELAYTTGRFRDKKKRSFVTLWKPSDHGNIHVILRGRDAENAKLRIYDRDKGLCQLRVSKHCLGKILLETCDLEHRKGGTADRCWCDENMRISCRPCHIIKDGRQPRFGSKGEADVHPD